MATARTRAARKYNEKAYDRIELKVPKGDKDKIKAFIGDQSLNAFINEAIQEKMNPAPVKVPAKKEQPPKPIILKEVNYTVQDLMQDWDHYIYVHSLDPSLKAIEGAKDDLISSLFPKGVESAKVDTKIQYICPFTGKKFGTVQNLVNAAIPRLISWREAQIEREGLQEKQRQDAERMARHRQQLIDEGKFPKY